MERSDRLRTELLEREAEEEEIDAEAVSGLAARDAVLNRSIEADLDTF
jgi:hypothetical protein